MRQIFLLIAIFAFNGLNHAQSVGMIGDFNNWTNDVVMNTNDNNTFTLTQYTLQITGGVKFRLNQDWSVNWGNLNFPNGFGFQDGPNIQVPAGIYDISINISSGEYSFSAVSNEPIITATKETICLGDTSIISISNLSWGNGSSNLSGSLTNGLVGYWPFNGNANDESGNGNHATLFSSNFTSDRFNNVNSSISIGEFGSGAEFINGNSFWQADYSISYWIRSPYNSSDQRILGYRPTCMGWGEDWFSFDLVDGSTTISHGYAGSQIGSGYTNGIINQNEWNNILFVKSGGIGSLYINGLLVGQHANMNPITQEAVLALSSRQSCIMNYGQDYSRFIGEFDDLGIWNRALTEQEIQQLYNSDNSTYLWSTGENTPNISVSPTETTTYTCEITTNGSSVVKSKTIVVNKIKITSIETLNPYCNGLNAKFDFIATGNYPIDNYFKLSIYGFNVNGFVDIDSIQQTSSASIVCNLPDYLQESALNKIKILSTKTCAESNERVFPIKKPYEFSYAVSGSCEDENNYTLTVKANNSTTSATFDKLDGKSWYDYPLTGTIKDIDFDVKGNVWITSTNGLYKFDGTNWINYTTLNSALPTNNLDKIAATHGEQIIWLTSPNNGLIVFNSINNTANHYTTQNSALETNDFKDIEVDYNGLPWLLAVNQDISHFDRWNNILKNYNSSNSSLPQSGTIYNIELYMDDLNPGQVYNILFVSTGMQGLQKYSFSDSKGFKLISDSPTYYEKYYFIGQNNIPCVSRDYHGNIYVASQGSGILKHNPYYLPNDWNSQVTGLGGWPSSIEASSPSNIWWTGQSYGQLTNPPSNNVGVNSPSNATGVFKIDRCNNVWIATTNGIKMYGFPCKADVFGRAYGLSQGTYSVKISRDWVCEMNNIVNVSSSSALSINTTSVASSNPTVCLTNALTNITHSTTGATGIGTATGLPTGVSAAWSDNTITISGTPTESGTFNYSIPLTGGCGTVNATGTLTVTAPIVPSFTQVGPFCRNATAPALPTTSNNSIAGTWNAVISTATAGTTTYTFTPAAGSCATTTTMSVTVNAPTTPTFTQVGPFCQNATATALPTTSTNSIAGTWNAAISTATAGTTTYTFTPTSTATPTCATTTTMSVTVNAPTTPTFTQVGPFCQNATAPALPTTSNNSIAGTWNATISTATAGTTTYTFTPSSTAAPTCATTATMSVTINAPTTPTFTQAGPFCRNAIATALPTTSNNSIAGTWNAQISTATAGTTTYTFTPTSTATPTCATTATMSVTVNAPTTPTFTQAGPFCRNATPATLPTTSNNSIAGTWNAQISTATAGTTTYTFTPTSTATPTCATTATMSVTVNAPTTPTFTQVGPFCQNATPATLPTTSNNSIAGTWNAQISTATAGTITYTFTPTSTAPPTCATTAPMSVTVNATTTSSSSQTACESYDWNGTTYTESGTYTFKMTNKVGCDSTATLNLIINKSTTSSSSQTACESYDWNGTTYTESGIYTFKTTNKVGCDSTATLNLIINKSTTSSSFQTVCESYDWNGTTYTESGTYTFKTTNKAGCDSTATIILTINKSITPNFTPIEPLCQNATATALPTTSINNIVGTWNPSTISTANLGSMTYTFAPASGQCATPTTMNITVKPLPNVSLTSFNTVCDNAGKVTLKGGTPAGGIYSGPSVSNNSFNPSIGIGTYPITYSFTNSNGCSSSVTKNLTVISCSSSSLVELNEKGIILYPNPTSEAFIVETSEDLNGKEYLIQDLGGRVLSTGILYENKTNIEVSSFSTGTYYIKILESNLTLKFIKQ